MEIIYNPIGVIHTPFHNPEDMPIQPVSRVSGLGCIEIYPEYVAGLQDLEGFSHIYLIYHFHRVRRAELLVKPFLDHEMRGIFSTRAPCRPNSLGLSLVEIVSFENNLIHVAKIDVFDKTPLLDIKPYVPQFESDYNNIRIGWLEQAKERISTQKSDDRFVQEQETIENGQC